MYRIDQIHNSGLFGEIDLPKSKSMQNRVMMIARLSDREVPVPEESDSNDAKVLYDALTCSREMIDLQDAGTPMRLFLAYWALRGHSKTRLVGSPRLMERSIKPLLLALESLGARFQFLETPYRLPLVLIQPIDKEIREVELDVRESSQFVSALLLIAPMMNHGLRIRLTGEVNSWPYVQMTLEQMANHGVQVERMGNVLAVPRGNYLPNNVMVESDWSSASFFYGLAALSDNSDIVVKALSLKSTQGDRACAKIYRQFGVQTVEEGDNLRLVKVEKQGARVELDFINTPDLFPVVLATAISLGYSGRFTGIRNLRDKESNRINAMVDNLIQFGVQFDVLDDSMEFQSTGVKIPKCVVNTFGDHRIAMAFSILATVCQVFMNDPFVVRKSFSGYWSEFEKLSGVYPKKVSEQR